MGPISPKPLVIQPEQGLWGITWSVRSLLGEHKDPSSDPQSPAKMPGAVTYTCYSSTVGTETGGSLQFSAWSL